MAVSTHAARLAQRRLNLSKFQPVEFTCPLGWAASGAWTPKAVANAWDRANTSQGSSLHSNHVSDSLAAGGSAVRPLQCKRSVDRFFMYAEAGQPDRLADDLRKVSATELISLPIRDFFDKCSAQRFSTNGSSSNSGKSQGTHQPPYHYFTARVADILEAPPPEWETHVLDTFPDRRGNNVPPSQLGYCSVWLGGVGSATQAHYDVMHNVFVQAHGFKHFRLWPPSAHVAMAVFPDAHPRARKSRLHFTGLDVADSSMKSSSAGAVADPSCEIKEDYATTEVSTALPPLLPPYLDIVLGPGQALYIPPFWFHHVEVVPAPRGGGDGIHFDSSTSSGITHSRDGINRCVDDSVSVSLNVFSQARLTAAVSAVLARPPPSLLQGLPLRSSNTRDDSNTSSGAVGRLSSGGLTFARLARRLGSELGLGSQFARTVLLSRYREVGSAYDFPADPSPNSRYGAVDDDVGASAIEAAGVQAEAWAVETANALRIAVRCTEADDGADFTNHSSNYVSQANAAQQEEYFEGVVSVCAAHILEATALRAFGAIDVETALEAAAC